MKSSYKPISELVERIDIRNSDGNAAILMGLSIDKCFIRSVANTVGTDLTKYKVICKNQFAVSLMQVSRDSKIPVACFRECDRAIMSPAYSIFQVADESVVLPDYLDMWFKRPEFDREAAFIAVGGVRGSMPWEEFARIKVCVPSLERQKEIVDAYTAVNERIHIKQQLNDNLEATIQAAFDKAFHDAGVSLPETIIKQNKVPQGWTDATVGDFASVQTGPFGSQLHNEDYVESGTPIITVEHMDGKYIAHRNLPLVSQNDVDRLRKYDLHTGDIVFSRVGSVDRAVMVSQHEDGWLFSGRCLRVRPYDPNTGSYFLWWFNQPVIRQLVTASAVGATMPSINTSILNSIRIVFPQKDIVTQFCKMADGLIEIIATNLEEIRKLNDAREYIQLSLSR